MEKISTTIDIDRKKQISKKTGNQVGRGIGIKEGGLNTEKLLCKT